MFGRKVSRHTIIDTLVGPGSRVHGDLTFSGGCHIDGTVNGNVGVDSGPEAALSISQNGHIEGSVSVPHVVLHGTVRGDVHATERVELGPTARVIGNVYYNLIEMAIGAEINGKLVHQVEQKSALLDETTGNTARIPQPDLG